MPVIAQIEVIAVAIITILAVISPGPDFAMVTRIALTRGRRAGVLCAIGIGSGVSVHLAYTLIGLGVVFASNVWVLTSLRYLGATYLIWLGISALWPDIRALFSKRPAALQTRMTNKSTNRPEEDQKRNRSAFWIGFACNALNPKTMLFIVSLFSQMISPDTPVLMEICYGLYIAACHMIWFALVAVALTLPSVQARIAAIKIWIERGVGLCLAGLGIKLLTSTN
ncbi:LysE family translocator [Thalassospira xiamenensis]|uniref:LysE family translocator n=1 Tax=Thalassospira xiamenensis TaxID=220697 RepID=UPI000DEDF7AE|nr:LysE family translocator [Thalassospira xiamenensis]MBR9779681.1 LysE family translocator [Rhodospirillales bacterium]MBR9816622.1 LysE family translocator [Rhodospirillales bacterium]RCK40783.1 lysine transporter LysE [Thalassospira xiamenensis]